MTKYKRITGKVFGGNATAIGADPQIAQFGSASAGTFIGTTDVETIQQLPAWGQGWIGAVTPETQFPALPEMTGAMKVLSHQICTAEQEGVSSWDSGTIYYTGNFVSKNSKLFVSLTDANQGNDPETDTTNWKDFLSSVTLSPWVMKYYRIMTGAQKNGIYINTYDVSSYLPNEGERYDILASTNGYNAAATSTNAVKGLLTCAVGSDLFEQRENESQMFAPIHRTGLGGNRNANVTTNAANFFLVPIGPARQIRLRFNNENLGANNFTFDLYGYRKVI